MIVALKMNILGSMYDREKRRRILNKLGLIVYYNSQ